VCTRQIIRYVSWHREKEAAGTMTVSHTDAEQIIKTVQLTWFEYPLVPLALSEPVLVCDGNISAPEYYCRQNSRLGYILAQPRCTLTPYC
jgi:hypothetical protein